MNGQCHGCAFKPGAAAYKETANRLTGIISALAGTPFYCHEKMGWTAEKQGYENGQGQIKNAVANLLSAPTLIHNSPGLSACLSDCTLTGVEPTAFDLDRRILGKQPICCGWKAEVANLAKQGWYRDKLRLKSVREIAKAVLAMIDELKATPKADRKLIFSDLRIHLGWFANELKQAGVRATFTLKEDK